MATGNLGSWLISTDMKGNSINISHSQYSLVIRLVRTNTWEIGIHSNGLNYYNLPYLINQILLGWNKSPIRYTENVIKSIKVSDNLTLSIVRIACPYRSGNETQTIIYNDSIKITSGEFSMILTSSDIVFLEEKFNNSNTVFRFEGLVIELIDALAILRGEP